MKSLIRLMSGAALVTALQLNIQADTLPGQVDFGQFSPPASGGQFVEVNVPSSLIALASHFVEKQEPDVADLLTSLKMIKVNVIGMDEGNKSGLQERVQTVRKQLSGGGWERLVTALDKQQDVGVYLKMGPKESVQGIAVTVLEGDKQAVFVNIVGDLKAEQLTKLGDRIHKIGDQLHIDPLKEVGLRIEQDQDKGKTKDQDKAEDNDKK